MPWACAHKQPGAHASPGMPAKAECAEPPTNAIEPSRSASYALLTGKMSSTETSSPRREKSQLAGRDDGKVRVRDQIGDGDPHGGGLYTGTDNLSYNLTILTPTGARMAYETITVEPLTARIGGIVSGVDLTKPVSQSQIDEIRAALLEHQVIFFPQPAARPRDPQGVRAALRRVAPALGDAGAREAPRGSPDSRRREIETHRGRGVAHRISRATGSRRWAASCISTRCRRWAATRCSRACMPRMTRFPIA
jgi:hypothetical protein